MRILHNIKIGIDKAEVYRYLGYPRGEIPAASISSLIDRQIKEAYKLIRPLCWYTIKRIKGIEGSMIFIEDSLVFTSNVISQALSSCYQAAIYLVTIGIGLEQKASELMRDGQALRGAILDAAGSEAVEKLALYFEEVIRREASTDGAEISRRYSPGYCDWDISQQKVLFQAMNSASLGVNLTRDCWMVPRKSTSGIIGIGKSGRGIAGFSPCLLCDKVDCPSRR